MRRSELTVLCAMLPILILTATTAAGEFPVGKLDRLLASYAEAENLAFVALVAHGDEVVFEKAYGAANRKRKIANRPDTAFDIGSISKTFTAAAIYRLATEGKLSLDDTLAEHFPGVPEDKGSITIDQVLNHISGLAEYHDRKGDFEVMSRAQAMRRIFDDRLQHVPGSGYAYSNSGYSLLAMLVEDVTGRRFRTYCREEFFEPLGMEHTGYYGDAELWNEGGAATGYGDHREGKNDPSQWRKEDLWAVIGNGGVVSTARDLLRWGRARERLFPEPDPAADLGSRRLASRGWYLARRDNTGLQVFHGGASDKGFIAILRSYPEKDVILVLLSNTFKAKRPHIRSHLNEIEDVIFEPQ